jgi:hypothetical protein
MDYMSIFILESLVAVAAAAAAIAAVRLPLKYISEHGRVGRQEVLVYFEKSILDL